MVDCANQTAEKKNHCPWYPSALAKNFIKRIGAVECIAKSIFSIKCKTKVLYEMTLLYIKDQTWLIFVHQKKWTIQWDPKLTCHPIALIIYSEQRLWNKNKKKYISSMKWSLFCMKWILLSNVETYFRFSHYEMDRCSKTKWKRKGKYKHLTCNFACYCTIKSNRRCLISFIF